MGKNAYPTAAEVQALLARAGYTAGASEAADAALAAVDEFERRAGRKMIAEASDRTRRYDPPVDGWLDLRYDLATFTSVVWAPQGGASETLVQDTDYWLESYNGPADAEPVAGPYAAIRFNRRWAYPLQPANRRSIQMTGRWGFATSAAGFPDDAWLAMLHRAGALLLVELGQLASGGRVQRTEAGVQTTWGSDPAGAAAQRWNDEFEAAIRRWRRSPLS